MTTIWRFDGSSATDFAFAVSRDGTKPITITHIMVPDKMREFAKSLYTRRLGDRPRPAAELILTLEDFDKDFFRWGGDMFVSERMREAMALDASEAQFFEVDASQSAPLPRSKNYQIMQPEITEELSDPEKSDYEMREIMPNLPPAPTYVRRIAFRAGVAPKHNLFFDRFFSLELFCTEAFASRVLEAGCTGMRFTDPSSLAGGDRFYRTARGIEKVVDWEGFTEITELVQAIE
jgi:hypothetical protein